MNINCTDQQIYFPQLFTDKNIIYCIVDKLKTVYELLSSLWTTQKCYKYKYQWKYYVSHVCVWTPSCVQKKCVFSSYFNTDNSKIFAL